MGKKSAAKKLRRNALLTDRAAQVKKSVDWLFKKCRQSGVEVEKTKTF